MQPLNWNLGFGTWDLGFTYRYYRPNASSSADRFRDLQLRAACSSASTMTRCYNCGRRNPGMWGYAPILRSLGADLGLCSVRHRHVRDRVRASPSSRRAASSAREHALVPRAESPARLFLFGRKRRAARCSSLDGGGRCSARQWLHAGLLHIMFNMFAGRQLGPPTADFYGTRADRSSSIPPAQSGALP
jgi:hypothetical protein